MRPLALLLLCACATPAEAGKHPKEPVDAPPADEFDPTYGEPVSGTAIVVFAPRPEGKGLQGTWLLQDDGKAWLVAYRPLPEWYPWGDRRVTFAGRPYRPSPYVQAVMTDHLEVTSIALAPGEPLPPPGDTTLPAPPVVRTADALLARVGRYAIAIGSCGPTTPTEDDRTLRTTLHLADGGDTAALIWTGEPAATRIAGGFTGTFLLEVNAGSVAILEVCDGEDWRCGVRIEP